MRQKKGKGRIAGILGRIAASAGQRRFLTKAPEEDYAAYLAWLEAHPVPTEGFSNKPVFALRIRGERGREDTLASLAAQTYPRHILYGEGEFDYCIELLAGDVLTRDALAAFAWEIQDTEPDILYADEDLRTPAGLQAPFFKPEASAFTLLSFDCIGRPLALSAPLYARVSPTELGDAAHYRMALAAFFQAREVRHVRRVLLHRPARAMQETLTRSLLDQALQAAGEKGYAVSGLFPGSFRIMTETQRRVSIVVFAGQRFEALQRLLNSIEGTTVYRDYSLIVADAGDGEKRLCRYLELLSSHKLARVVAGGPGFAACCNKAAEAAAGDSLVFLSPQTEIVSPYWLSALMELLERGAGAAGGKLTDPQGRLLYAGGVVGLKGFSGSPYTHAEDGRSEERKNRFVNAIRQTSVLSAGCLAVDADTFFNVGCFDESFSLSCGAGEEFCLRLMRRNLAAVYTPYSQLYYHGAMPSYQEAEEAQLTRCYDAFRPLLEAGDPFYGFGYSYADFVPRAGAPKNALTPELRRKD